LPREREARLWLAATALVVAAAGAAFWAPALRRTGGGFPVPPHDGYIHLRFPPPPAPRPPLPRIPRDRHSPPRPPPPPPPGPSPRAPRSRPPGGPAASRGARLAWFAALCACVALVDLARSLRRLVAPRWIAWAAPALLVAVPLLDWSLFSGMEVALLGAVLG